MCEDVSCHLSVISYSESECLDSDTFSIFRLLHPLLVVRGLTLPAARLHTTSSEVVCKLVHPGKSDQIQCMSACLLKCLASNVLLHKAELRSCSQLQNIRINSKLW